ncbi:MAG: hypothetical protein HYU25_06980 [Candidatus Rokubacteria bacterium]|nr:hypothetical protein [Candidatus Rokubacteria bacterium]
MAPKIANIGPRGRRRRVLLGAAALAAGVAILILLLMLGVDRGWRALLVVPFWVGALGVLQARAQT